jgi:hypothetical protein
MDVGRNSLQMTYQSLALKNDLSHSRCRSSIRAITAAHAADGLCGSRT